MKLEFLNDELVTERTRMRESMISEDNAPDLPINVCDINVYILVIIIESVLISSIPRTLKVINCEFRCRTNLFTKRHCT